MAAAFYDVGTRYDFAAPGLLGRDLAQLDLAGGECAFEWVDGGHAWGPVAHDCGFGVLAEVLTMSIRIRDLPLARIVQ